MPKHAATGQLKPLKPRQRYRPPNRALSPNSIVEVRNEIRVKNIIHRLQDFALDDPDNPKSLRMTRTQAMVALSLLKKCLPDMQTLEISGNQDQPITVQVLRFSDPLDALQADNRNGAGNTHGSHGPNPAESLVIDVLPERIEHSPGLIEDEQEPKPKRGTRSR